MKKEAGVRMGEVGRGREGERQHMSKESLGSSGK